MGFFHRRRFLRAFNYWVMLDLFGKSTFITEENAIGTDLPQEISRKDLFAYIESELLAIDPDLAPAHDCEQLPALSRWPSSPERSH